LDLSSWFVGVSAVQDNGLMCLLARVIWSIYMFYFVVVSGDDGGL
jgi:hypothetical protein